MRCTRTPHGGTPHAFAPMPAHAALHAPSKCSQLCFSGASSLCMQPTNQLLASVPILPAQHAAIHPCAWCMCLNPVPPPFMRPTHASLSWLPLTLFQPMQQGRRSARLGSSSLQTCSSSIGRRASSFWTSSLTSTADSDAPPTTGEAGSCLQRQVAGEEPQSRGSSFNWGTLDPAVLAVSHAVSHIVCGSKRRLATHMPCALK